MPIFFMCAARVLRFWLHVHTTESNSLIQQSHPGFNILLQLATAWRRILISDILCDFVFSPATTARVSEGEFRKTMLAFIGSIEYGGYYCKIPQFHTIQGRDHSLISLKLPEKITCWPEPIFVNTRKPLAGLSARYAHASTEAQISDFPIAIGQLDLPPKTFQVQKIAYYQNQKN